MIDLDAPDKTAMYFVVKKNDSLYVIPDSFTYERLCHASTGTLEDEAVIVIDYEGDVIKNDIGSTSSFKF